MESPWNQAHRGRESARAWIVFSRPMSDRVDDPAQHYPPAMKRNVASVIDCMQAAASKSVYMHVTLLLETGRAFSVSLEANKQKIRVWNTSQIAATRFVDDVDSKNSFKTYRRLNLDADQLDKLDRVAESLLKNAKYPTLAYYTSLIFGHFVPLETIARYTAGPLNFTCASFVYTTLVDAGIITNMEPATMYVTPDSLLQIPMVKRSIEDQPHEVAEWISAAENPQNVHRSPDNVYMAE